MINEFDINTERLKMMGIEFYIVEYFTVDDKYYSIGISKINLNIRNKKTFKNIDVEEIARDISSYALTSKFSSKEESLEFLYRLIDAKATQYRCAFSDSKEDRKALARAEIRDKIKSFRDEYGSD